MLDPSQRANGATAADPAVDPNSDGAYLDLEAIDPGTFQSDTLEFVTLRLA